MGRNRANLAVQSSAYQRITLFKYDAVKESMKDKFLLKYASLSCNYSNLFRNVEARTNKSHPKNLKRIIIEIELLAF